MTVIKNQTSLLTRNRPIRSSLTIALKSTLKKSISDPTHHLPPRLLDSSTPSAFQSFKPPNTKLQTLTLRTDPASRPAKPTTQALPHCNHRTAAIAAARHPKPKIRFKQILNLYVLHSLILSLLLFFFNNFNGFNEVKFIA